jgi:excisionase family DNA binding protein
MPPHLLDDLIPAKEAARQLGHHVRTIMRWTREPGGLPFVRLGQRPYLHLPTVRRWIERRMERPNPARTTQRRRTAV